MKLTLKNKTDWSYRDLRKIVYRGLLEEADLSVHYLVVINNTQTNNVISGDAENTHIITLRLPSPHAMQRSIDAGGLRETWMAWILKSFAQVLVHEIGHCLGLEHKDMVEYESVKVSWMDGLELWSKEEEKKRRNNEQRKPI